MKLLRRFRTLFRKDHLNHQLSDELAFHLEKQVEQNLAAGMSAEDARQAASRKFGGVEQVKEQCRDAWGVRFIDTLIQDVRFGLRMLGKNPGVTAVAMVTLALGIGANTTIFSVAWRPMRYHHADRLLVVWETRPDGTRSPVSAPTYLDWRDQTTTFERLAAVRSADVALAGTPPTLLSGAAITPNFFDTFDLRPELGRFFLASDFRSGSDRVAILSHEIWQSRFGGEANIVDKSIRVNGQTYTVVGVAPAEFEFFGRMDVWTPLVLAAAGGNRQTRGLLVVGRMRPGASEATAREEVSTLAARVAQESPATNRRWSALAQNFQEALAGPSVFLQLILLFTIVTFVLLMACANVANLLLARGSARTKEIAVRMALGASRWRVARQLIVETFFLAVMGGTLGLLFAFAAVHYLATFPVLQAPGLAPIEINRTVLEFVVVLCLAATLFSGLLPAWRTTAANLLEQVKAAGRTAAGDRGQRRLRNGLVMAELALSLVLMVTAGLSVRSFLRLAQVNPGFHSQGLVAAYLSLPAPQYSDATRVRTFYTRLLGEVRAMAGVEAAAISTGLPPASGDGGRPFRIEGRDPAAATASGVANYQVVSPGYFRTLGVAVRRGRDLNDDDRQGSPPVVVINHRLADKYFPSAAPLGKRLVISVPGSAEPANPQPFEIVGVVNDVKNVRLTEPSNPELYGSYLQTPAASEFLLVRSPVTTETLVAGLRNALLSVDPDMPMVSVSTMDERLDRSLSGGRVVVALMSIFAALALLMGSVGLYGVVAYAANQRTAEFALRMALGASRRMVFRLVAGGALRLLLIGGAAGLILALGVARLLGSMMFGISPYDPVTFGAVVAVLIGVVLTASYLPARRAMKVDPMVALRYE